MLHRHGVILRKGCKLSNVKFQGSAEIETNVRMIGVPQIVCGTDFYANVGCHFLGEITFGNYVMVGPQTVIWGRNHSMNMNIPMKLQPSQSSPIVIGDDVWIGAHVTILKGITIGCGAVVGAGSVVVHNVPPYAVVVGNPAHIVKFRNKKRIC